ncbi:MAG TPA: response regulator [Gemmatimonadaceae bacterium]|nr:response regulator [Gemmatimonadaceae bacterium]
MSERRAHVLVIDDNLDNRTIFSTILEHAGYRVTCAETGPEGLEQATSDPPELILLDLNLPGLDGWEVARRLKAESATSRVPILIVTAHAQASDELRAVETGCAGLLEKPVDPRELRDVVGRHLMHRPEDAPVALDPLLDALTDPGADREPPSPPPA